VGQRVREREERNRPIRWPAYAIAGLGVIALIPGVATFLRERQ